MVFTPLTWCTDFSAAQRPLASWSGVCARTLAGFHFSYVTIPNGYELEIGLGPSSYEFADGGGQGCWPDGFPLNVQKTFLFGFTITKNHQISDVAKLIINLDGQWQGLKKKLLNCLGTSCSL